MGNYGDRIKKAREAVGLTQEQLGKKIGVTGVTIMRYEKNQREPRQKQLQAIASALGVSVDTLYGVKPLPDIEIPVYEGQERKFTLNSRDQELEAFNDYLKNMGYRLVIELATFESVNPNHYWTMYDNRNGKRYFVSSEKLDRLMNSVNSYTKYQVSELISELEEVAQNTQGK